MKNKKGFFLAETIAVIAVVAVVLVSVFKIFSSVYLNYRQSEKYNTVAAINALANVEKYYQSVEPIDVTVVNATTPYVELTNYGRYSSEFYTKIKQEYNVTSVYLVDLDNIEGHIDELYLSLRKFVKTLLNKEGVVLIAVVNNDEFSYINIKKIKGKICKYSGELAQGAEFTDGQYIYKYKQEYASSGWTGISEEGWGVRLADLESTTPITTRLCTYINNKPIVSMRAMFSGSNASSVDLSSFDTENVTNMRAMFFKTKFTNLDFSSFDTRRVTNMYSMFQESVVSNLDLSSFDTSAVTNMGWMFYKNNSATINLSSFNTSSVTNMAGMFEKTTTAKLDLSSFNTGNVTDMREMFLDTAATELDLSNFDTSEVVDMNNMFNKSEATTLDLSSFDTSKVTNMHAMFTRAKASTINLSSFNTSHVTNMNSMFQGTSLIAIDLSSFDTSHVTDMAWMFYESTSTTGYAKTQADANRLNASSGKPAGLTFVVG